MSIRGIPVLFMVSAAALVSLSCQDRGEVAGPVEPSFAKPVKPVPVEPAEPKLEEFWVFRDNDQESPCYEGEVVHVVVSGDFLRIETNVTQEHWFNGVQDTDVHFESRDRGPAQPETTWNEDRTLGHIDVCFKGERLDYIYGDGSGGLKYFVDSPSISIGDDGADPFAFMVWVVTGEKQGQPDEGKSFRPTGVVVGGETKEQYVETVSSMWHEHEQAFADVRSYAVWEPEEAEGYFFFKSLGLEATCRVVTTTVGRGKNATTVTSTTVTATATFGFGAEASGSGDLPPDLGYLWTEAHLRVSEGETVLLFTGRNRVRHLASGGTATYTWSVDGDRQGEELTVELLVDWLTPEALRETFIYHPGLNHEDLTTTAGWGEDAAAWDADTNVSTKIGDGNFPVVRVSAPTVTCTQG